MVPHSRRWRARQVRESLNCGLHSRKRRGRPKFVQASVPSNLQPTNKPETLNKHQPSVPSETHRTATGKRVKSGTFSSLQDRSNRASILVEKPHNPVGETTDERDYSARPIAKRISRASSHEVGSTPTTTAVLGRRYLDEESIETQDHDESLPPNRDEAVLAEQDTPEKLLRAFADFRALNQRHGWSELRKVLLQAQAERRMSEVSSLSTDTKFWTLWDIKRAQTLVELQHPEKADSSVIATESAGKNSIVSSLPSLSNMSTSRTETQVDRSASVASPDHGDILLKPPVSRRKRRPRSGNGKSAVRPYSTTSEPGQSSQGAPLTRSARRAARSCLQLSRGSETERQPRSQQVQQSRPSRRSRLTRRSSPSALGQSTQFGHDDQPRDLVVDASSDVAMAGTPPLYAWAIDDILEQDDELLPWIEEQLDTLSSFPISEDAVEQLLRMLTIEQIYDRMLTMTKWRQYAQQMFTILYCAQRHLTALELIDALLVQVCVSCDLDPKHASYKAEAHSQMANICFTAMLQSRHDGHRRQVQKKHPFVVYAIQYWPEHLLRASYKMHNDTQFSRMFRGLQDSFSMWVHVWNIDFRGAKLQQDKLVCSLYYAALLGLTNVITDICERINSRSDPTLRLAQILKQRGGSHGTALQAASYGGHMYAVELLRQKAADVNT